MLLGLTKRQVEERFEALVEFADLHEFIDVPVKFYSSGMFMRLGFSVAVHVEPDVMLVDEVLAVGDASFQLRCLNRLRDLTMAGTRGARLVGRGALGRTEERQRGWAMVRLARYDPRRAPSLPVRSQATPAAARRPDPMQAGMPDPS